MLRGQNKRRPAPLIDGPSMAIIAALGSDAAPRNPKATLDLRKECCEGGRHEARSIPGANEAATGRRPPYLPQRGAAGKCNFYASLIKTQSADTARSNTR